VNCLHFPGEHNRTLPGLQCRNFRIFEPVFDMVFDQYFLLFRSCLHFIAPDKICQGFAGKGEERVEVIVKSHPLIELNQKNLYPLRGKSVQYKDPFDSVAEEDWEII